MQSDPRIKTSLQGDDGYIISHKFPLARGWRLFQKIPASVQIFHALSPRDPDCLHWPLIFQEVLMDTQTWYKASFGASDLGESIPLSRWVKVTKVMDILGVLLIRTLDDTRRYSSKIAITSRWWWIHNRYHISQIPFARCWRLFQKIPASVQIFHAFSPRDPDYLLSSLICQELPTGCLVEWTLRDLWRVLSQASLLPKQRHSFRKQEPYRYSRNLYLRWSYQCPNTTTAYRSDRNGKTQPTQGLGCTEGDLTASFPYAILLWSSTEQWSCKLVPRKSEQHRSSSIKKRKQMSRCRFQVALCGWCSFSKPWQWV